MLIYNIYNTLIIVYNNLIVENILHIVNKVV